MKKAGDPPTNPSVYAIILVLLGALVLLTAADNLLHAPYEQVTTLLILAGIDFYDHSISSPLAKYGTCRFRPTCSNYMRMALLKYGSLKGARKGVGRILRCSPFTRQSGLDYP